MLIVLYVIKTLYESFMIFCVHVCQVFGEPVPTYSVGVNRSHRNENLKIEYYACLYMKSQLLFLEMGL